MHVTRIGLTPVKGGRHAEQASVDLTLDGPVGDRVFCLVDPEDDLPVQVTIAPEGLEGGASTYPGVRVEVDDGAPGYGAADLDLGGAQVQTPAHPGVLDVGRGLAGVDGEGGPELRAVDVTAGASGELRERRGGHERHGRAVHDLTGVRGPGQQDGVTDVLAVGLGPRTVHHLERGDPAPVVDVQRAAGRRRHALDGPAREPADERAAGPGRGGLHHRGVLDRAEHPAALGVDQAEDPVTDGPVGGQVDRRLLGVPAALDGGESDPGHVHRHTIPRRGFGPVSDDRSADAQPGDRPSGKVSTVS